MTPYEEFKALKSAMERALGIPEDESQENILDMIVGNMNAILEELAEKDNHDA